MAGPSTSYRIRETVRAVGCRLCHTRLDPGDLRVDTLRASQVRASAHAECFIRMEAGSELQLPGDLEGWDNLATDLQNIVLGLLGNTSSRLSPKNDSQSSVNCPQTSLTPLNLSLPSFQASQQTLSSQPMSEIVSRTNTQSSNSSTATYQSNSQQLSNSPLPSSQMTRHTSTTSSIIDLTDFNSESDDYYDSYDDDDDEESLPSQDPKRPKLATDSQGNPVMPDLLAGVAIPAGPARSGDECSVCLEPPLHPVTLPCGHVFCFLCAKGLTRQGVLSGSCSLCRQVIPDSFLDSSQVISGALDDVDTHHSSSDPQPQTWSWFYEGRNGWWRFEERCNEDLETTFLSGKQSLETIICGQLYVIDFVRMEQFQKRYPTRKRKIKRDLKSSENKGIAGLQTSQGKTMSQGN